MSGRGQEPKARLVVRFEPLGTEMALAPSERMLDALDAALGQPPADARAMLRPALPTACRAANCGACLVRVESGAEAFAPAAAAEVELLRRLGAPPDARLGCQLHACASLGSQTKARLRPVQLAG